MQYSPPILEAVKVLSKGGIVAYPTEAVFGLGCDPFNTEAVSRLLRLKHRSPSKGLLLIADCFERFRPLIESVPPENLKNALMSWPGPYTWVFPANLAALSEEIRGQYKTIAIRVTAHPLAYVLCQAFERPLVSTSANRTSKSPLRTAEAVLAEFGSQLDYILEGEVGNLLAPTPIRDVLTGEFLRGCSKSR